MEVDPTSSRAFIVIFGIIALAIMALNLLIIIAILKDPLGKLRSTFSYLLIHLCVCNFLTGVIPLPIYMYFLWLGHQKIQVFSHTKLVTHLFYIASVFSTFTLSIDRYKAIRDPVHYHHSSSIKRVVFYILGLWSCVAIDLFGQFFYGTKFRLIFGTLTFSLMVTAGPIMYFRIRSVFNYYNHQGNDPDSNKVLLLPSPELIKRRKKIEKSVLDTCKVLVGLQIISWLPVLIVEYGELFVESISHKQAVLAGCVVNILGSIGAIGEPLVCIFRLKNFKKSIKYSFVKKERPNSIKPVNAPK